MTSISKVEQKNLEKTGYRNGKICLTEQIRNIDLNRIEREREIINRNRYSQQDKDNYKREQIGRVKEEEVANLKKQVEKINRQRSENISKVEQRYLKEAGYKNKDSYLIDQIKKIDKNRIEIENERKYNKERGKKGQKKNTTEKREKEGVKLEELTFRVINIDGLTLTKYIDIEDRFFKNEENNIVCLTETHKKVEDIYISRKIKTLNSMRKKKDKKGGVSML